MKKGCPYGSHRVLEPAGVLPQAAWRLDNTMELYDNELLIEVDKLNIDAASFRQISEEAGGDPERIKEIILRTVNERGKQHNPVTGSGGMLIGSVREAGESFPVEVRRGQRIATLVSLTLTPLRLERIYEVDHARDQVRVDGQAVLFASGVFAPLPGDLPEDFALAVLDVAGAPAQTARLVKPGDTVLVIGGGGKSGLLCLFEAGKRAGVTGRVAGVSYSERGCSRIRESGFADIVIQADATRPLAFLEALGAALDGALADITINCVDVPGTEMASILATRDGGTVYFFSMATSFTAAALGAEGVGRDVRMLIGNGYARGHADVALDIARQVRHLF
ncbi:MAG: L-erythro-3,5-diaminohexanoate dehydrogenase [Desulfobacteraceae bacterium]